MSGVAGMKTDLQMHPLRSWLFVPGNRPDRIAKALTLPVDTVVLDLEDGCPPPDKRAARRHVRDALANAKRSVGAVYARCNDPATDLAYDDLEDLVGPSLDGVMLPKTNDAETVRRIDWLLSQLERRAALASETIALVPLVESAEGMYHLREIASASRRVRCLAFGAADLALDLALRCSGDERELQAHRSAMVLASRAARIAAPIDSVWLSIDDVEGLRASAGRARAHGFQGKMCIHPAQVPVVHAAFETSDAELERARRIVAEFEAAGRRCIRVDGMLVDPPIVASAIRLLSGS